MSDRQLQRHGKPGFYWCITHNKGTGDWQGVFKTEEGAIAAATRFLAEYGPTVENPDIVITNRPKQSGPVTRHLKLVYSSSW